MEIKEITFRPDGIHPLDERHFKEISCYKNVTIQILYDEATDTTSIGWIRQPNTEEIESIEGENNDWIYTN